METTTSIPTMATPEAAPLNMSTMATPAAPAAPAAPEAATPSPTFANGGEMGSDEKIKWVAIAIFSITIIAVAYKAVYYKKAISLLGADQKRVDSKLKELEKNIRAIRKDNYETMA